MAHKPYLELIQKLENAKKLVKAGGIYYHWKDPQTHYKVLDVGFCEWDEKLAVVYKNMENGVVWIRPLEGEDGWLTPAEGSSEKEKRRFVPVS